MSTPNLKHNLQTGLSILKAAEKKDKPISGSKLATDIAAYELALKYLEIQYILSPKLRTINPKSSNP